MHDDVDRYVVLIWDKLLERTERPRTVNDVGDSPRFPNSGESNEEPLGRTRSS